MLDYTLEEVLDFIECELCTAYESYRDDDLYDALVNGEVSFTEAMSYYESAFYESADDYFLEAGSEKIMEDVKRYISSCEEILKKYKSTGQINEKLALIKAKQSQAKIHKILTVVLLIAGGVAGQALLPVASMVGMVVTIVGLVGALITGILAATADKKVKNTLDDVVYGIADDIDEMKKSIEKVSKDDADRLASARSKLLKTYRRYEKKVDQEEIRDAIYSTR
jgi:ElaB/YqjD/DUF883 family membrane-anchored ribosome-binding protein